MLELILALIVGYVIGVLQRGIHIHHHHESQEMSEEYNETPIDMLDPEVKNYLDNNDGIKVM